jgi:hypothetical protein
MLPGETMSKAFGHEFIVVNDIVQRLDPTVFEGGPWLHLATVKRGFREYMAFRKVDQVHDPVRDLKGDEVWVEIVDPHTSDLRRIEDDNEWDDVVAFLRDAMLLEMGTRREIHIDNNTFKD